MKFLFQIFIILFLFIDSSFQFRFEFLFSHRVSNLLKHAMRHRLHHKMHHRHSNKFHQIDHDNQDEKGSLQISDENIDLNQELRQDVQKYAKKQLTNEEKRQLAGKKFLKEVIEEKNQELQKKLPFKPVVYTKQISSYAKEQIKEQEHHKPLEVGKLVYIEQGKIFDDEPTILNKIVHEKYTDVNVPYSDLSDDKFNLWDGDMHNVVPDHFGKVHYSKPHLEERDPDDNIETLYKNTQTPVDLGNLGIVSLDKLEDEILNTPNPIKSVSYDQVNTKSLVPQPQMYPGTNNQPNIGGVAF